jgi:predicted nucleic acid-binding protein
MSSLFDSNVASEPHALAALHVPDPRAERDALIAATAMVHGLTVATRNRADFESTGVPLFNPWEG